MRRRRNRGFGRIGDCNGMQEQRREEKRRETERRREGVNVCVGEKTLPLALIYSC